MGNEETKKRDGNGRQGPSNCAIASVLDSMVVCVSMPWSWHLLVALALLVHSHVQC
jgi:hypothetical protein